MRQALHQLFDRAARIYGISAASIFLASGIVYLVLGRWPVTHQDFWVIYDTCLHHSWFYSTIFKYNGHSCFFPAQLWLADLRFLHGNQDFLFAAGLAFELIGTALLVIPIWSDKTVGRTPRVTAVLTLIVGNFWMGRASMTASGGFNTAYSLVLVGGAVAFVFLPVLAQGTSQEARLLAIVIFGNVLASFSFGTGLACWGATLLTGYCLRFRFRTLLVISGAAAISGAVFVLLPPHDASASLTQGLPLEHPSTYLTLLGYFCRLLGSPLLHISIGWSGIKNPPEEAYSDLALWGGILAFLFATTVLAQKLVQRNLRSGLEATGFALMIFNYVALALITVARATHITAIPAELNAPRYLYWSSLFWAGLILVALRQGEHRAWLRRPLTVTALALPILAFPSHYKEGLHYRYVRLLSREAATSLIDGIHDNKQIDILSPFPDLVYRLAKEMKADRLDMFASGYADWLGRKSSTVFVRKPVSTRFRGDCSWRIVGNGIRINGSVKARGGMPDVMVILSSDDVIRGIARSSATPEWVNRCLYGRTFRTRSFIGFVASFDPRSQYIIRSAQGQALSSESIPIPSTSKP